MVLASAVSPGSFFVGPLRVVGFASHKIGPLRAPVTYQSAERQRAARPEKMVKG